MAKLRMVGECPKCGAQFVRPLPCTHATCDCQSAIAVTLEPAIILAPRQMKQIETVSKHSGIPIDKLTNELLAEASKAVLRGLKVKE